MNRPILAAESVTELGTEVVGAVLVVGSHGGLIACYLGAKAGAHALILNDAGIGLDKAGIAGLAWLDAIGMAAATVSYLSARIGDGKDGLERGIISHANPGASAAGVAAWMKAGVAVRLLVDANAPHSPPPSYAEGRWKLGQVRELEVWTLDSVGKLLPDDAGRVLLIGSHGALHGGRPDSALNHCGHAIAARAAAFNDAGIGIDGVGTTRLPELARRGIPAVTVACTSARIGDGRSMHASGVISCVNECARSAGANVGDRLADWVATL